MAYSPMFCTTGPMDNREPLRPLHPPGSLPLMLSQLNSAMEHGMITADEFRKAVSDLLAETGSEPVAQAPAIPEPENRRAIKLVGELP